MLKKCLITIAVVALLATTVQAIDNPIKKEGGWPFHWTVTYDDLEICQFDVILEVGYYVQITNCGEIEMKLEQVDCVGVLGLSAEDFPCYQDCVEVVARANFDAVFGASFTPTDPSIVDENAVYWENDLNEIVGDGAEYTLKLCMDAWGVALWNSGGSTGTVTVGSMTIVVKPPLANDSGDQTTWPPTP